MTKNESKRHLAVFADERVRLERVRVAERRIAQAEFARVVSRLEVEDDFRRAEALLAEAEINLAMYGDVAEPIKQGFFQKLLDVGIVVQGKRVFEAVVAARRAQLERLRAVDGPERIARADELARVLRERGGDNAEPPRAAPAEADVVVVDEMDAALPAEPLPATPHKPNGRPSRSPYG